MRIMSPPFDRYSVRWSDRSAVVDMIEKDMKTFIDTVTDGRVVYKTYPGQVGLDNGQVLGEGPVGQLSARLEKHQDHHPTATAQLDCKRTSRNKRWSSMPRPASNQSITGSAYSCIDAVNITSVYHPETCIRCLNRYAIEGKRPGRTVRRKKSTKGLLYT